VISVSGGRSRGWSVRVGCGSAHGRENSAQTTQRASNTSKNSALVKKIKQNKKIKNKKTKIKNKNKITHLRWCGGKLLRWQGG